MAYSNGYSWRATITFDHTKVPSAQTNFPVLISSTDTHLKTTGNGGVVQSAAGYDIVFFAASDGSGTKLDHEIEAWSATTGAIVAWVRIPTLSSSSDTVIYLFAGNSGISSSQQNVTGVWDSNFKGVFHLADNAASTVVVDSTGIGNGAHSVNTDTKDTTGKVGGGLIFTGASSNWTDLGRASTCAFTANYTLEAWVYADDVASYGEGVISKIPLGAASGFGIVLASSRQSHMGCDTGGYTVRSNGNYSLGVWYHLVARATSNMRYLYLNGVEQTENSNVMPLANTSQGMALGRYYANNNDSSYAFSGILDEIRISNVARSADWITAQYNNQSSPSAFYSLGSWAESGGGGVIIPVFAYQYRQRAN